MVCISATLGSLGPIETTRDISILARRDTAGAGAGGAVAALTGGATLRLPEKRLCCNLFIWCMISSCFLIEILKLHSEKQGELRAMTAMLGYLEKLGCRLLSRLFTFTFTFST